MDGPTAIVVTLLTVAGLIALTVWAERKKKHPSDMPAPATTKLPLWSTVAESYRLAWKFRWEFIRIWWFWVVLIMPIQYVSSIIFWPQISSAYCVTDFSSHSNATENLLDQTFNGIVTNLIVCFFGASAAVAWHRLILLGEKTSGRVNLQFGRNAWSYAILAITLYLMTSLPPLAAHAVAILFGQNHGTDTPLGVESLSALFLIVITTYYFVHLTVMLPSRALNTREVTIKETMSRTRYNFWRLFWGGLLSTLVPLVIGIFIIFLMRKQICDGGDFVGPFIDTCLILANIFLILPFYLTFLSLTYKYFFKEKINT